MSSYPFHFNHHEAAFERPRARRLSDQHFGLGITPQDYLAVVTVPNFGFSVPHHGISTPVWGHTTPHVAPFHHGYYRPWRNVQAASRDVGSTIMAEKDKFQVNLDVQHFAPEEISVKTVDGYLVIEAKHEEKKDEHGFIARSFSRRYLLPEGIEADNVTSKLSSDGVLTISAPLKAPPKASNERVVPITHTGPVKKQAPAEAVETKIKEPEK